MVFLGHRFIPLIKLALQNFQQLADKLEPQLTHSFGKIIHCSFVPTTFAHVDVKLDLKIKVNSLNSVVTSERKVGVGRMTPQY